LGLADFNHHFCGRVFNVDFFKDCSAIVSYGDVTEAVDEHLVHTSGTKGGFEYFADDASGGYIVSLGFFPTISSGSFFEDEDGLS
jgi:hypothetical protein